MTLKLTIVAALAACLGLPAQTSPSEQAEILKRVTAQEGRFGDISRQIWEFAETQFQETRSAALLRDELKAAGFRIEENIGGMPTAFIATWGAGKPVIGILGEYDALPGLSQEAIPERKPRVEGGNGHGCGHNLFGSAAALGAIALKEQMTARKLAGTIKFFGTPAEEGGGGKIFMIRAGAFSDVDAALVWHPAAWNSADDQPWLANISAKFRFHGRAAHAAASPEAGRSALDAVEITSHAINLLREHVPQSTRMHYVVTKGGAAANIVPDLAEMSIIVRHTDLKTLEGIWERVLTCAQAGALATETRFEFEVSSAYANYLPNAPLRDLLDRSLKLAGGVHYTAEEKAFAEKLRATLADQAGIPALGTEAQILPPKTELTSASTDVGDVSWVIPTGQFYAATFPPGVPFHTWQSTASAGSSLGRKGMMVAAKTFALAGLELLRDPELLAAARNDYSRQMKGKQYRSLVPADKKPSPR